MTNVLCTHQLCQINPRCTGLLRSSLSPRSYRKPNCCMFLRTWQNGIVTNPWERIHLGICSSCTRSIDMSREDHQCMRNGEISKLTLPTAPSPTTTHLIVCMTQ